MRKSHKNIYVQLFVVIRRWEEKEKHRQVGKCGKNNGIEKQFDYVSHPHFLRDLLPQMYSDMCVSIFTSMQVCFKGTSPNNVMQRSNLEFQIFKL